MVNERGSKMRKLIGVLLGVLVCVSCMAEVTDNSDVDKFQLFQGDDKGMGWSKPLTRGQAKVVLGRMGNLLDAKIETLDEVLAKKIEAVNVRVDNGRDQGNHALDVIKAQDSYRAEEISSLKARISDLQEKMMIYKEQLDYVSRAKRDDIKAASLIDGAQEEWLKPWYAVVEIANAGANSYNRLEAGYDLKYSDLINDYTLTPLIKLVDNGLYFGFKGQVRFGQRN